MSITISDDILRAAGMSGEELMLELAVLLYQKGKVSLAKAASLAGLNRLGFQQLLADRRIPVNYDVEELESDLATLRRVRP